MVREAALWEAMIHSPSFRILYPHWQSEYQAALLELDHMKLQARVAASETAILSRLQMISQSLDHQAERQAIEDALTALRVLKKETPEFPRLGKEGITQRCDRPDLGLC
jgi:hypothetical protein